MPTLKPFAQYNETHVINLFSYSGSLPATKGTFVKIITGWQPDPVNDMFGDVGLHFNNTVSQRYGVRAFVGSVTASGDNALGMLLYDVRELDENGEKLIFHPRKAAENDWILSGQAVPVVTKGIFYYSGILGNTTAGSPVYLDGLGAGIAGSVLPGTGNAATQVGKALGPKDANGYALIRIDL